MKLEDYGFIGDTETGALVGRNGSIDWLCMPRFDSAAAFAALLGDENNGCWRIAPVGEFNSSMRYRPGTLVLETVFETAEGRVRVVDFMPPRTSHPDLVRIVEGESGRVSMRSMLRIRFGYGRVVPWVRRCDGGISAVAGPDALHFVSEVETRGEDLSTVAEFSVGPGESVAFSLIWHPSHLSAPAAGDPRRALRETEDLWQRWSGHCCYEGEWRDQVLRSLITLKALTYRPTGGVVAALTTSVPEQIGGMRNWDYRFCWLRDATFTLLAFLDAGYTEEAQAWRDWLLRAVAGDPAELQIMYGVAGERMLLEYELPWLSGYENSQPVRAGNAAFNQLQIDVYGEVMDAMHQARSVGIAPDPSAWKVQRALLDFLETGWKQPDEGIWEVRGKRRQFTHSKVMAWVAFDRAVKAVRQFGLDGPAETWEAQRDALHREVCEQGFHPGAGAFTQSYGSTVLDASLLMLPLVGFLPARDARVSSTVDAIAKRLTMDGFVLRYHSAEADDGLPAGEGTFLPCSFWLVDNYVLLGRRAEARALFEKLLGVCSPLGLLAEEYDPRARRLVGNIPQAFSHVGLVNSALNLSGKNTPAAERKNS